MSNEWPMVPLGELTVNLDARRKPVKNQKNMNSIPFVKAASELNQFFSTLIAPLYAQHRSLVEEIRSLTKLRDTLLPKLLSGELAVEKLPEEATACA